MVCCAHNQVIPSGNNSCSALQHRILWCFSQGFSWNGWYCQKERINMDWRKTSASGRIFQPFYIGKFSVSQTKRFPSQLSLLFCPCCLYSLCWMNISLSSPESAVSLCSGTLLKSCHVSQWTGNCPQKAVCTLTVLTSFLYPFSII